MFSPDTDSASDAGEPPENQPTRISTGSKDADRILGGGYLPNTINVIMGAPGTGKTIFTQQMCFHNATGDRKIVYLTTLSEPLGKILRFLQHYAFFDQDRFENQLVYEDLGHDVAERGTNALLDAVERLIKQHRPKLLVVDSFKAVHDLIQGLPEKREFMFKIAALLTAYDTTSFLVGEYEHEMRTTAPEFAVADSILELLRLTASTRDMRYCRVLKLRGSAYRTGMHALALSSSGVSIYPRLVAPADPAIYETSLQRISSGIPLLDDIMHGGIWAGTTTLVLGPTGSGKTTLGLQFLQEGARQGEPGLYLFFQENPSQFRRRAKSVGATLTREQHALIELMYQSPVEIQVDSIIGRAFQIIEERQVRRVVVDSVGDLAHATDDWQRLQDYLYSLTQYFTQIGISSVLLMEGNLSSTLLDTKSAHSRLSPMADNLILLHLQGASGSAGQLSRCVQVVKMRNSEHSMDPAPMRIEEKGICHA